MRHTPRRTFLKGALGGLAVASAPAAKAAPSERVNVAVMGLRGRGRSLAQGFAGMPEAQVVALCDVDTSTLEPVAREVHERQQNAPKLHRDVRALLEDPSIDALVIATPDHWHALATIWACQAGKHAYVEKPASHNIFEGRKMVEAARKHRRVVQVGTQSRSAPHYIEIMKFLASGKIGTIHMAKAWNSQRRGPIGRAEDTAAPDGVDYDLWLGPAPLRPFNPLRFHSAWHWHWDYGTGDMGNDGVHDLDIARWGLGVTAPSAVTCGGALYQNHGWETPDTQFVTFSFPESKAMLVFEQRDWSPYVQEGYENGVAFYGTEGYVLCGRAGWSAFGPRNAPIEIPKSPAMSDEPHRQDFLTCVKTGKTPAADIEEGHRSSTLAHLGNIAYRVGRSLAFDPATETIAGDSEASALLRRDYRRGFEVPETL
jgi:predicted dehydrogenase